MPEPWGGADDPFIARDLDAERAVLGSVLLTPACLYAARALILSETDFALARHRVIWAALNALADTGVALDLVTLHAHLEQAKNLDAAGGHLFLAGLGDSVPSAANVEHYAKIVRTHAIRRRLHDAGRRIAALAEDLDTDRSTSTAQEMLQTLAARGIRGHAWTIEEVVKAAMGRIESVHQRGNAVTGVSSGFTEIDRITTGWQRGDLILLAARPSMGKTALALAALVNAAKDGCRGLCFSFESLKEPLGIRLIAMLSGVDSQRMRSGRMTREDWAAIGDGAARLYDLPILVEDTRSLTIREIETRCRIAHARGGLGLVIVDYLQLVTGAGETRNDQVGAVSAGLKRIAGALDVPVIALSQLNRSLETRNDKRPQLSDLRDSGSLEQDADVVMFLYRDDYYNKASKHPGEAELCIAKQRNGPTDTLRLRWVKERTLFLPLDAEIEDDRQLPLAPPNGETKTTRWVTERVTNMLSEVGPLEIGLVATALRSLGLPEDRARDTERLAHVLRDAGFLVSTEGIVAPITTGRA